MGLDVTNTQYPKKTVATQSAAQTNSSNSSVGNIPVGQVIPIEEQICNRLNITKEEFKQIVIDSPNFANISEEEQVKALKAFRASQNKDMGLVAENQEVGPVDSLIADKVAYNELTDVKDKFQAVLTAFAKDLYVNGRKDKDGNQINEPHSLEEWNNLSDEDRNNFVNGFKANLKNFINNNENVKYITDLMANDMPKEAKEKMLDEIMLGIQAKEAYRTGKLDFHRSKDANMSFADFMKLPKEERQDIVYEYMNAYPESLNENDQAHKTEWNNLTSAVKSRIKGSECGVMYPSDVAKYIKYNNLVKDELLYEVLTNKTKNNMVLSKSEQKQYEDLKFFLNKPVGKEQIKKAKVANLAILEAEYAELKAKGNKKDEYALLELEEIINSEESARLRKEGYSIEIETELDARVLEDVKEINENSSLDARALVGKIELNMKGMSPKERCEYIKTFFKFYSGSAGIDLFKRYAKEHPELYGENECHEYAALNGEMTLDEQRLFLNQNKRMYNSGDKRDAERATNAIQTQNEVYTGESCKLPGLNVNKRNLVAYQVENFSDNSDMMNGAIDLASSITNADMAIDAGQSIIQASDNPAIGIHLANKAKDFVAVEAQAPVMNAATDKYAEVTAYVAENNLIAGLAKEAQIEAFEGTHNAINKHFEGEDAIKYSIPLADQIQNCDKDNQLAMHDIIMGSQYSEVQEHAAGNIGNYDPSVQGAAMDRVYASGNTKAIEAGVRSIVENPKAVNNPVYQEVTKQEVKRYLAETALNKVPQEQLQDKFLSGNLSADEVKLLPYADRKQYIQNYFRKLPMDQKIKLLSGITSNSMKKTIYTSIARTDSHLFNEICRDKDRADNLLSLGLPQDVILKVTNVVKFLAVADVNFQEICKKHDIEYKKTDVYPPKTASTVNYASLPNGLKNEKFDLFAKDRHGYLLG